MTVANQLVVRKNVEAADIASLRDAYAKMQALSATDNRSWLFWAGYHGFPQYQCWHHGRVGSDGFPYDLFLPWHRAYLQYFEHTARDQNEEAILSWWDWTSQTGIPASYSAPRGPDRKPNPLASGPMPAMPGSRARRTRRSPDVPANLPSPDDVTKVLGLSSFVDFSNQLQDLHDQVHGWVSGDMGVIVTSAFDPIFWAHHCMIDRLWYLWQLRWGVTNIPPNYLRQTLAPWALTVQDVLDIQRLGYEYAGSVASSPPPPAPRPKASPKSSTAPAATAPRRRVKVKA
jgi:tyrosinase